MNKPLARVGRGLSFALVRYSDGLLVDRDDLLHAVVHTERHAGTLVACDDSRVEEDIVRRPEERERDVERE